MGDPARRNGTSEKSRSRDKAEDGQPLVAALELAARGWPVFPLAPRDKVPALRGGRGVYDATTERAQIQDWWERDPARNVGVALGRGLVVVDVDRRSGGDVFLEGMQVRHGLLPETVTVETADGFHFYFEGSDIPSWEPGPGVEVRSVGYYVVGVESVHPTGHRYRYAPGRSPDEIELASLPGWLRRPRPKESPRLRRRGDPAETAKALRALEVLAQWRCDSYAGWLQVGMALHATGDDLLEKWETWSKRSPKWEAGSCQSKWETFDSGGGIGLGSLIAWAREDSPGFDPTPEPTDERKAYRLTDVGNGARMADQHRERVRYCYPWRRWLIWDGRRWRPDLTGEIDRLAKETVRELDRDVLELEDTEEKAKLRSWATKTEKLINLRAMVTCAQSEPAVPILPEQLDRDPWLLTVENGTLNLRTAELREHRQEDRITKLIPIAFDPEAECPRWGRFLLEVTNDDTELTDYLQRAVGYSLTGDTREHVLFFLWGSGRNGKSVFETVLLSLLGDYSMQTPTETLLASSRGAGSATPELARLKGARLVAAVEADQNRRLAESLVKQITGGDTLAARGLYQDLVEFKPEAKLWLASNHKPNIHGQDFAIWSRIHLVPFTVRFEGDRQDKDLAAKLERELPGILAWAVRGCLAWQRDGLNPPDRVLEATQAYREEQDVLGTFLAERCDRGPDLRVGRTALWDAYRTWCKDGEETPLRKREFYEALTEKGLSATRDKLGRYFEGVALTNEQTRL